MSRLRSGGTVAAIRGLYEKVPGTGIWWVRWTDSQGQLHREKAGRRGDALTLLAKRRTETIQKKKLPEKFRTKVTFDSLCDDAMEHSKASNGVKVTHDLGLKIAKLRPVFGTLDVANITKQDIVRWLTSEAETRQWSASTRNRWQAAFSLIFRVGIDNERIDQNPASRIHRQTENNARIRFLSVDEETRLRAVILRRNPARLHDLHLSLHTGMRAGEQLSLKWSQIDFERNILSLHKTKNGDTRHIPLNSIAIAALKAIHSTRTDTDGEDVFPSRRKQGSALTSPKGWFNAALKEAEIVDYTWHCNRHTFASRLVMAGVDLRTIGGLLGHRTMAMTMRYSHLAPAHNASAVEKLVPVLSNPTGTRTDTSEKGKVKQKNNAA